jgi:hypothetical protein
VSRHALRRSRLTWLNRFIVPRETPLAASRWHQCVVQRRISRLDHLRAHRPNWEALALYQTVVFASAVAGPLLGGWLADTFGFHVISGASGAGRLLGILLYVWLAV